MTFNYSKFICGTNSSGFYEDWDKEFLETLKKAGDAYPIREYSAHVFVFTTVRDQKLGGCKRNGLLQIYCFDNGEIGYKMQPFNEGYIASAIGIVYNFISVMSTAGYIIL